MKHLFAISLLIIAAGCQSNFGTGAVPTSQTNASSVKPMIWEPPTVVASNGSTHTASFAVSSACNPVPWSPSSGVIQAGSTATLTFTPNGNPCPYQSATIKADDTLGIPANECDLLVIGSNIDVVNNSNTNCSLTFLGSATWGFGYKLLSQAKTRHGGQSRGSHGMHPNNVAPELIASNHDSVTVDFKLTTPNCQPWTLSSALVLPHQSAIFTSTSVDLTCGADMLAQPSNDPAQSCTLHWSGLGGQFLITQDPSVTACNLVSSQSSVTFVFALAGSHSSRR